MKSIGYYNGRIEPLEQLMIPALDRAVYFGDGCYEAVYLINGVLFGLEEHLDRFYNSCRLLKLPFHLDRQALKAELQKVIEAVEPDFAGMLYWQASRGTDYRNHAFPPPEVKPNLLMFARPAALDPIHPKPLKLISLEDTRFLHCNIKTINLLPSVMANQEAHARGCDEAVLHRGSRVTEGSHSNILILQNGTLRTPPADELILPGITRKHLLALAGEHGIPTSEQPFSMVELMNADEILVTSSGALCSPVCEVDGIPVGGKDPDTLAVLQKAYADKFLRETKQI